MKRHVLCIFLSLSLLLSACGTTPEREEYEPEDASRRVARLPAGASPAPTDDSRPEPTTEPSAEPTPDPAPAPTAEPTPTAPSEPVTTVFEREGDYADDVGNSYHYLYRIPAFSCGSADAEAMNRRVYDFVMDKIQSDLDNLDNDKGISLFCSTVDYAVYVNGDIVSVLVWLYNDWGFDDYLTLNLDTWTQREASRDVLLASAGLNEVSFLERAKEAAAREFGDYTKYPEEAQQFAEDQYAKTVMEENLQDTQLFINGDGKLCMVVRVFSMAGADYYWRVVEL